MTAGNIPASPGVPGGGSKERLDILLADYQACREDERVLIATVAAVFGVLITIMGLMVAAITQTCQFTNSKTCLKLPDYLLATSPMIPLALLAFAIYFMVAATLRTYYMRGLENEIRCYATAPIASLGEIRPASYVGIVQEVTSLRRGRLAYRLIAYLILVVVILIFGGYAAYVGFHVKPPYQITMGVVYSIVAILFVWQVAQGSIGGRAFFERAARDFLEKRQGDGLPKVRARSAARSQGDERSLISYLIFPRPEDWIKWLIAPGVFVAVACSSASLRRWPTFLGLWLILEYLIYEARYQWNDMRGVSEDLMHGERRARRRLPADPNDKYLTLRNILISLAVALCRLILAIIAGWKLGFPRFVLLLMLLVFSIAVAYEILRSRPSSSASVRSSPTVAAIWCIVGLGYGVRAGLGIIAGGFPVSSGLAWIGIFCFIAFGIMFVLLTWVLEAASCHYRKKSDGTWWAKEKAILKPHLTALLPYVSIDSKGRGRDAYNDEEDGTRKPVLYDRGRVLAPWNLALVVGVALGGAFGVGLAHPIHPGYWPESITALASLAAAFLLVYCNSQLTRLLIAVGGAAALLGIDNALGRWPFDLLGAAPWLAITSLYVIFRGSSYRDLKDIWTNLTKAIKSAGEFLLKSGLRLLNIIIGDSASRAAGTYK